MSHVNLTARLTCLALILAGLMISIPSSFIGSHAAVERVDNERARATAYSVARGGENPSSKTVVAEPDRQQRVRVGEAYGNLPLSFESNRGQADPQVKFISRGSGYSLFLTSTEAVLALSRQAAPDGETHSGDAQKMSDAPPASSDVLRMKLAGANPHAQVTGAEPQPGKTNYFVGNDRDLWRTGIQNYAQVRYESVYPGIDLVYYGNQRQLEFDFRVAPGANPHHIRMTYAGAQQIFIDKAGDLVLRTAQGDVRQHKPVLYQEANGGRREIYGRYVMKGARQVSFEVGRYDRSKPLVIDPVLGYSTYLGGSFTDRGYSIAVDSGGNAYVAGVTFSSNFPTSNPMQGARNGSSDAFSDAFVVKLNPAGSALIYATYLGGAGGDRAYGVTVDGSGNAYLTGNANSSDFPTVNALQSYKGGGDLFVAKLNAAGSALVYSTYLGGMGFDRGLGIAVDPTGNAYITGFTESGDFTTVNSLQPVRRNSPAFKSINGGSSWSPSSTGLNASYIYALVVNPSTPTTLYAATEAGVYKSTDSGNNWSAARQGLPDLPINDLVLDPSNPATLYAATFSGLYKTTDGGANWIQLSVIPDDFRALAIDPSNTQTIYAGTKASVNSIIYKSTNGGATWMSSGTDIPDTSFVYDIAVDPVNPSNVYASTDFVLYKSQNGGVSWSPISITANELTAYDLAIDPSNPATLYAATEDWLYKSTNGGLNWTRTNLPSSFSPFLHIVSSIVIDPANSSTIYAGTNEQVVAKSTDGGNTWTTGTVSVAQHADIVLAINPINTSILYAGGYSGGEALLVKLNPTGTGIVYSTYLGGDSDDVGTGVAADAAGNAYITGYTESSNFPVANALQPSHPSPFYNAFVAKVNPAGSSLVYSTYLGGSSSESGRAIAVDAAGNAYVTGYTTSDDFPTVNPLQGTCGSCSFLGEDAFVTKLNPNGSALIYSTYFGGSSTDIGYGIAVDPAGNAYITGETNSSDLLPLNAPQPVKGQTTDAFVAKVNPAGSSLIYSTYLGGNGQDYGFGISVGPDGSAYVAGQTGSNNFPTASALQPNRAGSIDAFVTRIAPSDASGASADLSLTMTDSPDPAENWQNIIYTISVTNNGPSPASSVIVNDPLPSLVNFVSTTPSQGTCAGQSTVSCNLGSLASGAHATVTIVVKATFTNARTISNSANVGANEPDPNTGNNSATQTTMVEQALTISGQVTNANGGTLTGITVTLSGAMSATTTTDNDGNYSFTRLVRGGNYTVTPSLADFTFSPPNSVINNLSQDFNGVNFVLTPTPPTLQLNQSSYSIPEGTGSLAILVNRSGALFVPVTVNYATTDAAAFLQNCNVTNGAATSRCDYVGVLGTLHFAAGETSKTISIPVVDDTYLEGPESLFISLSNPSGGAVIGANQRATIQITDNSNDVSGIANPIDDKSFFVRQHYIDFLSREPDPLSAGWITILNQCGVGDQSCRLTVSQGIYGSPEFRDRGYFIYKFYSVALGRKPGYDEFNLDRARVSGFQTEAELEQSKVDFISDFISRAEFTSIYNGLSNNGYVQRLFTTAGVTQVTVNGVVQTVSTEQQLLAGGRTRAQVLRDIAESPEVSARFQTESTVVMHYFGYLRRDPDAAYQQWINILNSTGDSRNVTSGFINSAEYRARFGQ